MKIKLEIEIPKNIADSRMYEVKKAIQKGIYRGLDSEPNYFYQPSEIRIIFTGEEKMKRQDIEEIHESLLNGQKRQMVNQIDSYGLYDFFADYAGYLTDLYCDVSARYSYFMDCTISYNRIKNR